jgi:hypothetical protein
MINNNLKSHLISSEDFYENIKFVELLILTSKGIKINLSFSNLKTAKKH